MESYNGYSPKERLDKFDVFKRMRSQGITPYSGSICDICSDPHSPVAPHSEDYSKPYLWTPPHEYILCNSCHSWLHKRFKQPDNWRAFKLHLRRGGYGHEFARPAAKLERQQHQQNPQAAWKEIAGRQQRTGKDWWELLTLMEESKSSPGARPRP